MLKIFIPVIFCLMQGFASSMDITHFSFIETDLPTPDHLIGNTKREDINQWVKDYPDIDNHAAVKLAICYLTGKGVDQNVKLGWDILNKYSLSGNPEAQYASALCHLNGEGCEKDRNKAIELLELASKNDDPDSEYLLASLYLNIDYSTYDYGKAYSILKKGQLDGHQLLLPNLALCHIFGKGIERDAPKGISLLKELADKNEEAAIYYSQLEYDGSLLQGNKKDAVDRLEKLARKGNFRAVIALFYIFSKEESRWDYRQNLLAPWIESANPEAMEMYGMTLMYRGAKDGKPNEEGVNLILRASDRKHDEAMYHAAWMLMQNYMETKDPVVRQRVLMNLSIPAKQRLADAESGMALCILSFPESTTQERDDAIQSLNKLSALERVVTI